MVLDNLVNYPKKIHNKLSEKFDHLYYGSLALIIFKGFDVVSTYLCVHKYGTDTERNSILRYCMDQLGITPGLIIHTIPSVIATVGIGHLANTYGRHKIDNDDIKRSELEIMVFSNRGSFIVYGVAAVVQIAAISNFIEYFR